MSDTERSGQVSGLEIAIIGMAGRFPGAKTLDLFWQNLRDSVESIAIFSDEEIEASGVDPAIARHHRYVKAGTVLDGVDLFDAAFFGYSPREAEVMDPQHRLFLECAWEALERAGYNPETYAGSIGVYAGEGMNSYLLNNLYPNRELLEKTVGMFQAMIANNRDHLSTLAAYKLNLRGPALTVQTACSTSLVAVHLACQSLLSGDCDMALAGGISITFPQKTGYLYQEGGILSPDGHCRAFDAQAQGTVSSTGIGIIVLKRLADACTDGDRIYAVIKGSAINNDGSAKVGYTAPSVDGQARVIRAAQLMAEVKPETIGYIEAHGTGTALGDPIEIAALTEAFRAGTQKRGFCAIGSVKTNIGHADAAAGIAGLIKTVLALDHKLLPPSLHFRAPNPKIDFANSPFYVHTGLSEWPAGPAPRRAGVSSFGIGGTNAHVILEEAPAPAPAGLSRPWHTLVLSARTRSALDAATANLVQHLKDHPDLSLADLAYTLQVGRKTFNLRRTVVCRDPADAIAALEVLDPRRVMTGTQELSDQPVVFLFPGQGAQYVQMAAELYQYEPVFREQVDHCAELLLPHLGLDLREVLYPDDRRPTAENQEPRTENHPEGTRPRTRSDSPAHPLTRSPAQDAGQELEQTQYAQPALFVIEYALARLWMAWGVHPQAMIGHSISEYVAACLAGVFSLEDALKLVAARGRLMQQMPRGAMLAVPLSEQDMRPLLGEQLALAAINAPSQCVVSGPTEPLAALRDLLSERGVSCRELHTSHAFHSAMMDPIVAPFAQQVKNVTLNPPTIPYISNVTGTWITAAQATDPAYWASHLRQAVRFADGVRAFFNEANWILLEVGPGRTLGTLVRQHPEKAPEQLVLASLRHPQDQQSDGVFLQTTLARLWLAGAQVDWPALYADQRRQRLPLPTYPFERQRYWIEPHKQTAVVSAHAGADVPQAESELARAGDTPALHPRPSLQNEYVAPSTELERAICVLWQEALGIEQVGIHDDFFELGGHSLLATQLMSRLRDTYEVDIPLHILFESPTVAGLATIIARSQIEQTDAEMLDQLFAEIGQLSEDEVQALLASEQ